MNLNTTYMGLKLKNPLVASASPLNHHLDQIRRLEDAGVAAVVMPSVFEEQLRHELAAIEYLIAHGAEYLPPESNADESTANELDQYLETLQAASEACSIPILGSLNGITSEGWVAYARQMADAGAAGLELNMYRVPSDPGLDGMIVENEYLETLREVEQRVTIPVAVKLSPYFTALANMARQFDEAGAAALVLFNRFYQPDIDIETLEVVPHLRLSRPADARLSLTWIAILHGKVRASLAASSGIHSAEDMAKLLLAGADVVMTTSALLQKGPAYAGEILKGFEAWMDDHEFESLKQVRGVLSQKHAKDPGAYERANYIKVLKSYEQEYTA